MNQPITLPAWLSRPAKRYITNNRDYLRPDEIALLFALSMRFHNSADELRGLARRIAPKVCREQQPNMKLLSRMQDDAKVFAACKNIVNRVCDLLEKKYGDA